MRVKGPWLPSYDHQTSHKQRRVWVPGLQSEQQQLKNLRNKARAIIDAKDPDIIAIGDKVIRSVMLEPNPEYSALHLFCAALDEATLTGETWLVCMTRIMANYEEQEQAISDATKALKSKGPSRLRGLLRTLTPRAFRARHEAGAEGDQHQRAGAVNGERATSARPDSA